MLRDGGGGMTPLQEHVAAMKRDRLAALDDLSDIEYQALVSIACDEWGHEAARVHLGRWLRDLGIDDDERAA